MALENNFWKAEFCAPSKDNYLGPKSEWVNKSLQNPACFWPHPAFIFSFRCLVHRNTNHWTMYLGSKLTNSSKPSTYSGWKNLSTLSWWQRLFDSGSKLRYSTRGAWFFFKAVIPLKSLFKYVPFLIHSYQLIFKAACWSSYKRDIVPHLFYLPVFETSAI